MKYFYYKINLNKFGEIKKQAESEKKTFYTTVFTFFLISIMLYAIVLFINGNLQTKLDNRKEFLKSIRKEIKSYQVSGDFLTRGDLERLADISSNRIFWTKKLVAFSEKTNDKIAITHFSFKNNVLSLFGITKIDKKQKEYDLIDDFITHLKYNSQINIDFPDIKFVKSSRDREKEVDILRFQIDCIPKTFDTKKSKRREK
ncbi:MAG: hypothetical protein K8S23_11875 [Candidatus Cloacimonetes bacterium]|nr:hypothetical protein [Candidatus Cloacimonadota bacterium]